MNAGIVACTAVAAFVVGSLGVDLTASHRSEAVFSGNAAAYSAISQEKGRFKQEGDNCVWDANDGGPNQCEPAIKGRFKKGDKDACTWDANDVGADQCRPPKGRWKKGGDGSCAWDANDGGPDQCNPRKVK